MTRTLTALALAALLRAAAPDAAAAQQPGRCDRADDRWCEELARIEDDPRVRRAVDATRAGVDRARADLIELTEIPAPPFGEEARGRRYAAMLREAGADSVWTDDEGNVLALRRGTVRDRTLAVSGHLDTVFPEETDVTVRERGDTLFAPGIGDDTRGLVVVLEVLRALEAGDVATEADVLFVGTVGEEGLGDLRGVKHLFREGGPRIDAFISVDGGGDERVVHQALGSRRYRVTYRGPGGHSWGAFGTANPAHALGRAINLFDEAADAFTGAGEPTSYNVGRVGGGTSVNAVPFEAWMEVDMRSESPERLLAIDSLFRAAVQRALEEQNAVRREGDALTADVELVGDRPSGATPVEAPLVQRMIAVLERDRMTPVLERSSTDSNVPIARGVPAITISRGGAGGDAHAPAEWWYDEDGEEAVRRALLVVIAEAGLARPSS